MARKRKGRCVKRNKAINQPEPEQLVRAPHSFVIHRGSVGKHIKALCIDFRKIMEPFTASKLQVKRKNCIKDFVSMSGYLHVSHMVMFTVTEISPYMRLMKLPHGPTLTFKIHNYSLTRDVISSLKKKVYSDKFFAFHPLVILNGFSGEGPYLKLMSSMFQSMFPTINITKVSLNTVKRCVMLKYHEDTKLIEFRHYAIRVRPTGLNRGVKKLISGKVPNLARFNNMSDFILKSDVLSDSEAEDDPAHQVTLPQKLNVRGALENSKSAIRVSELGPRLTLQLIKVEEGVMDGEVMFHEYKHKTEEEIEEIRKQRLERRRLKEQRKREQEENIKKKEALKAEIKKKCIEGMKKKTGVQEKELESDRLMKQAVAEGAVQEEDDDREWFRQEVGREPEPELFESTSSGKGVKRKRDDNFIPRKMPMKRMQNRGPRNSSSSEKHNDEERKNPMTRKGDKIKSRGGKPSKVLRKKGSKPPPSKRRIGTKVKKGKRF